ncbi:MAG: DnaA/Hda family protein [Candidatus Buchananbacteria bacterium]
MAVVVSELPGENPWLQVLEQIKSCHLADDVAVSKWLATVAYVDFYSGVLRLGVPSDWHRQEIAQNFGQIIESVARKLWTNFQSVEFLARRQTAPVKIGLVARSVQPDLITPNTPMTRVVGSTHGRFKSFVQCSVNMAAYAAVGQVAQEFKEGNGPTHPFIFLWGGSGLGKTHLLEAAYYYLSQDPQKKVILTTAEKFLNDMMAANISKQQAAFRKRFREADAFLLDEADFANDRRPALCLELKLTLDELAQRRSPVIVAANLSPQAMKGNEALVSRFRGGLTLKLGLPDLDARMAIVKQKAAREKVNVSDEVAGYLAKYATSDVRQLLGATTKLIALHRLIGTRIDLAAAAEAVGSYVANEKMPLTIQRIIEATAKHFKKETADLKSRRRLREIVYPRQVAMFLCARLLENSNLGEIAKAFGKKDHTTVIYSCKIIESDLAAEKDLAAIKKFLGL